MNKINAAGIAGEKGLLSTAGKPTDRLNLDHILEIFIDEWSIMQHDQELYLRALFTAADIDHSRRIDFKEFSAICRRLSNEVTGSHISSMYREALESNNDDELDMDTVR